MKQARSLSSETIYNYIADHGLRESLYLQVCYLLADDTTVQREFGVLESIHDNFPKYVLSMDTVDRSRNGITNMNIADWLLDKPIQTEL